MSLRYPWEKFFCGILILAQSEGHLQNRLRDAYTSELHLVDEKELPEDLRADLLELQRVFTSVRPKGDEGSVAASTNAMSDTEAQDIAEKVLSLFSDIARAYGRS